MKLQLQNMRGFNLENYLQHLIFEGRILMLCFDINTILDSKIKSILYVTHNQHLIVIIIMTVVF